LVYFKFRQVPFLRRITKVAAGYSGGYAALMEINRPSNLRLSDSTLLDDVASLSRYLINKEYDLSIKDCVLSSGRNSVPLYGTLLVAASKFAKSLLYEDNAAPAPVRIGRSNVPPFWTIDIFDSSSSLLSDFVEYLYTGLIRGSTITQLPYETKQGLVKLCEIFKINVALYETPSQIIRPRIKSLFNDELSSDVIFCLRDGERAFGHRCILACRTSFFRTIFSGSNEWNTCLEGKRSVVNFPDIKFSSFHIVLRWIYGFDNKVFNLAEFTQVHGYLEAVLDVLAVADMLLIDQLKDLCASTLLKLLTINNSCELFSVACDYHIPSMESACLEFSKPLPFKLYRLDLASLRQSRLFVRKQDTRCHARNIVIKD
jgi:hypothetical protein